MPLPPAPSRRAAILAPEAYEASARTRPVDKTHPEVETRVEPASRSGRKTERSQAAAAELAPAPAMIQVETKSRAPAPSQEPAAAPAPVARRATSTRSSTGTSKPAPGAPAAPVAARSKKAAPQGPAKLFVLDTNVLLHDPTSLFRFEEHDIFLPMIVLEELDGHKKGMTEVARNGRQTSRTLDALAGVHGADIAHGLKLDSTGQRAAGGHLFFQTVPLDYSLPTSLPQGKADNQILGVVEALRKLHAPREVVLVSKDINMRVKARALGLNAEDYQNDKTLEDGDLLYSGVLALPTDFWVKSGKNVESWQSGAHTYYRIGGPIVPQLMINQFVYFEAPGEPSLFARVSEIREKTAVLQTLKDYGSVKHAVWGVTTRNREQNYAMNLLMDPEVDFVTLTGTAGTGKTLLALAAGLTQVLDDRRYTEIIMTRATVSVGKDIGFLPGTEEEKMGPWMGAPRRQPRIFGQRRRRQRRRMGPCSHQRTHPQPHQDQEHELHARPHLPEQIRDHRRGAKPDAQADENADHPRRPRHQDHLHGQPGTDRHTLPHRRFVGPHLRGGSIQGLAAQRAHHAGTRRALAPGRFCQ